MYKVTLYNQARHIQKGIEGSGRTRKEAFRRAFQNAASAYPNELFFRDDRGKDLVTRFRVMFYDLMMPRHRTTKHLYMSDPPWDWC